MLTLDHISNGRIELGLGTGLTIDPSYAMTGLPNWEPKERVDRFEEYIDVVARLLSQKGGSIVYYESTEGFVDHVSRVVELGVSDVGLYYPLDPAQLPTFEKIASDVLPGLRARYSSI